MNFKCEGIKIPFDKLLSISPKKAILEYLGVPESKAMSFKILRESLDSRFSHSKGIFYEYSASFAFEGNIDNPHVKPYQPEPLEILQNAKTSKTPIIVGTGPAGLFSALRLLDRGMRPLLVEQGKPAEDRANDVNAFFLTGKLLPDSNIHNGFGGAGMFSDAKLTSRSKNKLSRYIVDKLIEFGAPDTIAYQAKPHLGTDGIREILENIEKYLIQNGANLLFSKRVTDIIVKNSQVCGIIVNSNEEINSQIVILACGSVARSLFSAISKSGAVIEPKPFSIGVRAEHNQETINKYIYDRFAGYPSLPPAEYSLTYQDGDRSVYTFCNCPGGLVVNSSSDEGRLSVNGMSESKRNLNNANTAIVAAVTPNDMKMSAVGAIDFQMEIEKKSYLVGGGGYKVPTMPIGAFIGKKAPLECFPTAKPQTVEADFSEIFPDFILNPLRQAMNKFASKIKGFDRGILSAPETRTSSPIRIVRQQGSLESVSIQGLYPIGEGAGYAGGIISSAIDGVKAADAIISSFG